MTKKELAKRINVDPKTITNWEKDKPELIKLIHLGLATEEHISDVENYLKSVKELQNQKETK
jgi:DNA-binding XRE family transcriptional regulator